MSKTYTYNFPMPAITVDCAIFRYNTENNPEVLLIKRKNAPYQGCWALPGGFMDVNETIEESTNREVLEETGVDITNQAWMKKYKVAIFDNPERDCRQRIVSILSTVMLLSNVEVNAGDDADECRWFGLNSLPQLAFDHKDMIKTAIKEQKIG